MYVDAKARTDFTASDIEVMADCKEKLENKTQLKRDLFIEDVCKNDQTVRFYTGIRSLACLFTFYNQLLKKNEILEWQKKKKEAYQVSECCFHMGAQTNSTKDYMYSILQ